MSLMHEKLYDRLISNKSLISSNLDSLFDRQWQDRVSIGCFWISHFQQDESIHGWFENMECEDASRQDFCQFQSSSTCIISQVETSGALTIQDLIINMLKYITNYLNTSSVNLSVQLHSILKQNSEQVLDLLKRECDDEENTPPPVTYRSINHIPTGIWWWWSERCKPKWALSLLNLQTQKGDPRPITLVILVPIPILLPVVLSNTTVGVVDVSHIKNVYTTIQSWS